MTIQGVPAGQVDELSAFLEPIRAGEARAHRADGGLGLGSAPRGRHRRPRHRARRPLPLEGGGGRGRHGAPPPRGGGRADDRPAMAAVPPSSRDSRRASASLRPRGSPPSSPTRSNPMLELRPPGRPQGGLPRQDLRAARTRSECPPAPRVVAFARSIGAIPAYAYLGDVGESPTGDKKAEKFEDDFIEELFDAVKATGFLAVAYMPPRNTQAQLERVRALCDQRGLMQISGVDINSPRQSFNCPELRRPEFANLGDSTWALVAHERLSSIDPRVGLVRARQSPRGPPPRQRGSRPTPGRPRPRSRADPAIRARSSRISGKAGIRDERHRTSLRRAPCARTLSRGLRPRRSTS